MADTMTPPARIARVTTRRMHTQTIKCPLDPEMLVAEFAGELPPEIAKHVREHLLFCETCSARSRALRMPYEMLSSLGTEPVPHVADLRDSVRVHVRSRRTVQEIARFVARLGRFGVIVLTGLLGIAVIALFLAIAFLYPAIAGVTSRSQNSLTDVPAAARGGVLYAETNKLVPIKDGTGHTWQVAEIIAVDEHTGSVLRSLPASGETLHVARANQLPVAVGISGRRVLEMTAAAQDGRQALVSFDAGTGKVAHITPLTFPGGQAIPASINATSLAISPDGSAAYIGLDLPYQLNGTPSVLVVNLASGTVTAALAPGFDTYVPLPPPPGSLPISAFPSAIPYMSTSNMTVSSGLHGTLALSPDGQWLFDVLSLTDQNQQHYALIRRFSAVTGALAQELALPGDFTLARLLGGNNSETPQLYLVTGSPDAHCFILDASDQGPTLMGDVPLGGPVALPGTSFTGSLQLTLSAPGDHLYITQDAASTDGEITSHEVWVVDVHSNGVIVHHGLVTNAGMVLPNSSTQKGARTFALRGGVISLTDPLLNGALTPWLQVSDGKPVIMLIATEAK